MIIPVGARGDGPATASGVTVPVATFGLTLALVGIYALQRTLPGPAGELLYRGGAIPFEISRFTDLTAGDPHAPAIVPPPLTVLTSLFLHGSLEHLAGNVWFLWTFGRAVERVMRPARFLAFYLLAGAAAAAVQVATAPGARTPMVGASGAIAGILGAYLVLFPRVRLEVAVFLAFTVQLVVVPAGFVLSAWLLWQVVGNRGDASVATWAHVGGFVLGLAACRIFARRPNGAASTWSPRPVPASSSSPR